MADDTCQQDLERMVRDKDYQTVEWWTGQKHPLDLAWKDNTEKDALEKRYEAWLAREPDMNRSNYDEVYEAWEAEAPDFSPYEPPEEEDSYEDDEPGGHVMDDTYIVSGNGTLLGVELITCTGGPHIYLDTRACKIIGKWWGLYAECSVDPRMASAVHDYWAEIWDSKKNHMSC